MQNIFKQRRFDLLIYYHRAKTKPYDSNAETTQTYIRQAKAHVKHTRTKAFGSVLYKPLLLTIIFLPGPVHGPLQNGMWFSFCKKHLPMSI